MKLAEGNLHTSNRQTVMANICPRKNDELVGMHAADQG